MGLFPKDRNLADAPERVELEVRASDFGLRKDEVSLRLDTFLQRHLSWRSRNSIQSLIKEGYVSVAAAPPELRGLREETHVERRPGNRLRHGMAVTVTIPEELRLSGVPEVTDELAVLYEDENVLVVDKPPLLPVHPSGRHLSDTLIQRIHAHYARALDPEARKDARIPVRLCHRLDRETSGLVLCGKNRAAHRKLMLQFEARRIEKEYLAIVRGDPPAESGTINFPLGPSPTSAVRLKMTVVADGLPSVTHWRVLERHGACALVACRPLTGRQHQIRVHLSAIGHPLVGDKLYGDDERAFLRSAAGELTEADRSALGLERHALHNHSIAFRSPRDRRRIQIESPLAADLRSFLDAI